MDRFPVMSYVEVGDEVFETFLFVRIAYSFAGQYIMSNV